MPDRLPAHIEVTGLLRAAENAGGFAAVLAKGERDSGAILAICCEKGANLQLYERYPDASGGRKWMLTKTGNPDNILEFNEYIARRQQQDTDLWVVELDIPNVQQFVETALRGS